MSPSNPAASSRPKEPQDAAPANSSAIQLPVALLFLGTFIWGFVIVDGFGRTMLVFFGLLLATGLGMGLSEAVWRLPRLRERPRQERETWGMIFGVTLSLALLAWVQHYRPDPLSPEPSLTTFDGWRYPRERNAFLRATNSEQALQSITAQPGTSNVWAWSKTLLWQSPDAGETWQTKPSFAGPLRDLRFADARRGLLLGANGALLVTTNAGGSWARVERLDFTPVEITDAPAQGRTLEQWKLPNAPFYAQSTLPASRRLVEKPELLAAAFSASNAWHVVGTRGVVFSSFDAGQSWTRTFVPAPTNASPEWLRFSAIAFLDPTNGWIATGGGALLRTTNAGASWFLSGSNAPRFTQLVAARAAAVGKAPARVALLGLHEGRLNISWDNGNTWRLGGAPESGVWMDLTLSAQGCVAASSEGRLYAARQDWNRFTPLEAPTFTHPLNAVFITDGTNGWAAGGFSILRTSDANAWRKPALPHRASPAPWFWAYNGLVLGWALVVLFTTEPIRKREQSTLDFAVADTPITDPSEDRLKFGELAAGLSAFIRNPNTVPPLTLAVSGGWGSGKSSILNLLRKDLARHRFPTVWFNAWHNQNEESLFAALLQHVVRGVPDWKTKQGALFRLHLYAGRIRKAPLQFILGIFFAAGISVALVLSLRATGSREEPTASPATNTPAVPFMFVQATNAPANATVIDLLRTGVRVDWQQPESPATLGDPAPARKQDDIFAWLTELAKAAGWSSVLVTGLGTLLALFGFWTRLKAFGVDPVDWISRARQGAKISDLEAKASFQLKFQRQFREVTEAMGDNQLVLFIDDLDRCMPEKTSEMLEAINFLTVSGRCFVVLGIDREQIEAAVGLGFCEMAAERCLAQPRGAAESKDDFARRNRLEFAKLYLRKLINVEIVVPKITSGDIPTLLTNAEPSTPVGSHSRNIVPAEAQS